MAGKIYFDIYDREYEYNSYEEAMIQNRGRLPEVGSVNPVGCSHPIILQCYPPRCGVCDKRFK